MKTFVDPAPKEFKISRLRLDPNNPRLKLHPGGTTEKELIERLCKLGSQSPSQVIKHILTDRGFLHNEIPVVFQERGKSELIVIDGNRRVAALKMILNNALIPSTRHGVKSDCEKLVGLVPSKMRCWVTHSKSDARRIVYRAHNEGTREWETLSKYWTHYDDYRQGVPLAEIVEVTGIDQATLLKQINVWILVEAMVAHIPDFQIESSGITSFERVTSHYAGFPKRMGFSVSSDGIYQLPAIPNLIQMIYRIYLSSAKASGFSRNVENNEASRAAFVNKIVPADFRPDVEDPKDRDSGAKTNDGEATGKQNESQKSSSSAKPSGQAQSNKTAPLPSERQILGVRKNVGKKAYAIYGEYIALMELGEDFPIACAALARAMIETTLKYHAKRLNCYNEDATQQGKQQSDLLDSIAGKLKQKVKSFNLPYNADFLSSITNSLKSIPELNDVMHKDGSFAARPAVKSAFASLAVAVENLVSLPP